MLDKLLAGSRVILGFVALAVIVWVVVLIKDCHGPKAADSVLTDGWHLPVAVSSVSASNSDAPNPKESYSGRVTVKIPPHPAGAKPDSGSTIEIIIPRDPSKPPIVRGDSTAKVEYQAFNQPILEICPQFLIGGSVSIPEGKVSPLLGFTFVSAWRTVYLDGLVDKFGLGPGLSWEFRENLHLIGKWNAVSFDGSKWSAGIGVSLFNL
jgi:hypothetical protein